MSIPQYLSRYAETEATSSPLALMTGSHSAQHQHVLVIPVKDEPLCFYTTLTQWLQHQSHCLVIIVVNQTEPCLSPHNRDLIQAVASAPHCQTLGALGYYLPQGNNAILLVDRATTALPPQQGVGLARKIGCDIALRLIHEGRIGTSQRNGAWIHCSDADVTFPSGYLEATAQAKQHSAALIYPFIHRQTQHSRAIQLYELRQHYYAQGLAWAGSPYGYTTVGSTLCIHANHYAKVRGFPKLTAGEDFHMLNKLAKTGAIQTLSQPTLLIEDRISLRVPFGTGPTLAKLQHEDLSRVELFEPTQGFYTLKALNDAIDTAWHLRHVDQAIAHITEVIGTPAAQSLKIAKGLRHAYKQSRDRDQFKTQWHQFADALATLRLLHCLSNHQHIHAGDVLAASPPWLTALQRHQLQTVLHRDN